MIESHDQDLLFGMLVAGGFNPWRFK